MIGLLMPDCTGSAGGHRPADAGWRPCLKCVQVFCVIRVLLHTNDVVHKLVTEMTMILGLFCPVQPGRTTTHRAHSHAPRIDVAIKLQQNSI